MGCLEHQSPTLQAAAPIVLPSVNCSPAGRTTGAATLGRARKGSGHAGQPPPTTLPMAQTGAPRPTSLLAEVGLLPLGRELWHASRGRASPARRAAGGPWPGRHPPRTRPMRRGHVRPTAGHIATTGGLNGHPCCKTSAAPAPGTPRPNQQWRAALGHPPTWTPEVSHCSTELCPRTMQPRIWEPAVAWPPGDARDALCRPSEPPQALLHPHATPRLET
ncbi:UNVERIFIED_CONTAM: hypothetical protein K2H54_056629 [Gekko kuhli]